MIDKTLLIDHADDAIIGYVQRCGEPLIVIYDHERLLTHFTKQGMSVEEASEWIDYNITGAWVGKGTPGVLVRANREEINEIVGEDEHEIIDDEAITEDDDDGS